MIVGAVIFIFTRDSETLAVPQNEKREKVLIEFPAGHRLMADLADTQFERAQGLSYRPNPQSMLFVFDNQEQPSFWMKDMNFAIDIIWLREGTVVGFEQNAQPEYPPKTFYTPKGLIDMVLEVPAGEVEANELHMGDRLDITFKQK